MTIVSMYGLWARATIKGQIATLNEKFATMQQSDTDSTSLIIAEALDVVMELHKAVDNEIGLIYPDTHFKQPICSHCVQMIYPCPTIEAIREKLTP